MEHSIVALDLGGTNIRAGVFLEDRIVHQHSAPLQDKHSLACTLRQVKDLIRPLLGPSPKGSGIGVPAVVDTQEGVVFNATNIPSWVRVPLKDILLKEFGIPVVINNDVNCFILGEHRFGLVRQFHSVVGLASGTGLGCGVIIDGRLYCGRNCGAGEIGLIPYRDKNIEYYCSGKFFEGLCGTSAYQVHQDALAGNTEAYSLWETFGEYFGHAIQVVAYAYDPEAIVIGGSLSKAYPLFESSMRKTFVHFEFPESIKNLHIYQSLDENMMLLGAAALVG
jgi:glucokinase